MKKVIQSWKCKKAFDRITAVNGLRISFSGNEAGTDVLKAIFLQREYADYFPFYQKVTVVDVGAHFGFFTLFAALQTHPESRIIAIEPDEDNFSRLTANIRAQQLAHVRCENAAMAAESGIVKLYKGASINHSIHPDHPLLPETSAFTEVKSVSLNDICAKHGLEHIDFLKLDCEGAEYDILLKTDGEILRKCQCISLEFHDLKTPEKTAHTLIARMEQLFFSTVKFHYEPSNYGLNYGKLIFLRK